MVRLIMSIQDYNLMILKRIERHLDLFTLLGTFVCWLSALTLTFSPISNWYALMDLLAGILLFILYHFRRSLRVDYKAFIIALIPIAIGALSFMDGGYDSAMITLFIISNVVSIFFLPQKQSQIISAITLLAFLTIWVWYLLVGHTMIKVIAGAIWLVQGMLLVLLILLLHWIVDAIKGYLMETIIDLEASTAKTYQLAYYDPLTGLPNAHLFYTQLENKILFQSQQGYFVIFSIKNLNVINAVYGTEIGNRLITEASNCFSSLTTSHELLSRMSGNEFILWTPQKNWDQLRSRLDQLHDAFFSLFSLDDLKDKFEYYVCFAPFDSSQETINTSIDHALLALTYAKFNQKETFLSYNTELEGKLTRLSDLRIAIKQAITNESFHFHYQPKVDASTRTILGVEALIRWYEPKYGHIGPDEFIPLVTSLNLDAPFGALTLHRILEEAGKILSKYGQACHIAINISPNFMMSPTFIPTIKQALESTPLPPTNLILEITEDSIIEGVDELNQILKDLKALGIKISLDDFGSGYSSLNYLSSLHVDELKIDQSLVQQIGLESKSTELLEVLVKLAKLYHLTTVAEGVETQEQYEVLKGIGVDLIQGYYFYRPEPL